MASMFAVSSWSISRLGMAQPVHVLNSTATVRGLVNMSALTVVDAQMHASASRAAAAGD